MAAQRLPWKGHFDANPSASATLDHLALSIRREDFDAEVARLRGLGLEVETTEHPWVQWRSLYFRDPEGNLVELVCFDPEIPWQGG